MEILVQIFIITAIFIYLISVKGLEGLHIYDHYKNGIIWQTVHVIKPDPFPRFILPDGSVLL